MPARDVAQVLRALAATIDDPYVDVPDHLTQWTPDELRRWANQLDPHPPQENT